MATTALAKGAALLQKHGPALAKASRLASQQRRLMDARRALDSIRKGQQVLAENRAVLERAGKASLPGPKPAMSCEGRARPVSDRAKPRARGAGRPRPRIVSRSPGRSSDPHQSESEPPLAPPARERTAV